jgi:hypothetical protein
MFHISIQQFSGSPLKRELSTIKVALALFPGAHPEKYQNPVYLLSLSRSLDWKTEFNFPFTGGHSSASLLQSVTLKAWR